MRAVAIRPEEEGPQNPSGIKAEYSSLWVPRTLFEEMSKIFRAGQTATAQDENAPLWRNSSRPVNSAFVYLDVSDFSKYKPGQQSLVISTLVGLISPKAPYW